MKLSEAKNRYVFQKKIYLKDIETDALTEDYVVLREPNMKEIATLSNDESANAEAIRKFMPNCIVDSSFELEDGTMAKGQAVYDVLAASASTLSDIMTEWLNSCPFTSRQAKKGN